MGNGGWLCFKRYTEVMSNDASHSDSGWDSGSSSPVPDYFPGELPRFDVGQIVRHLRYRYQGVIVDFDVCCQADEAWYARNKSQPDRDQPWYHVLVDESSAVTYVAESNLANAPSNRSVKHPLMDIFFEGRHQETGRYLRSDEIWAGWD